MQTEQLMSIIKQTAVIFEQFEARGANIADAQRQSVQMLKYALEQVQGSHQQLLNEVGQRVSERTEQAVKDALATEVVQIRHALLDASDKLIHASERLHKAQAHIATQTKILTWKALISIVVVFSVLMVGGSWITWQMGKQYQDVRAKTEAAEKTFNKSK